MDFRFCYLKSLPMKSYLLMEHFVWTSELATSNHSCPTKELDLLMENFAEISAVFQTANVSFLNCVEVRRFKNHVPKETQASVVHTFSLLESWSSESIQNRNESFIFDLAIHRTLPMRLVNAGYMAFLSYSFTDLTTFRSS